MDNIKRSGLLIFTVTQKVTVFIEFLDTCIQEITDVSDYTEHNILTRHGATIATISIYRQDMTLSLTNFVLVEFCSLSFCSLYQLTRTHNMEFC